MIHQLQPDDRVLVLQTGQLTTLRLREWALALSQGLLVGLDNKSAIATARRELVDCENTLFVAGSREEIPWRASFFTVIFDARDEAAAAEVTQEMRRVLHPSGRIYSIEP